MTNDIQSYIDSKEGEDKQICIALQHLITTELAEATSKVWHGAPVWFLDDNPVVGYDVLKNSVQLLFWSGQSFDEPGLESEGSFKAAAAHYTEASQIDEADVARWLTKARDIQWDYKNIVKNNGVLNRLK